MESTTEVNLAHARERKLKKSRVTVIEIFSRCNITLVKAVHELVAR